MGFAGKSIGPAFPSNRVAFAAQDPKSSVQTFLLAAHRVTIAAMEAHGQRDQRLGDLARDAQRGDQEALERLCIELQGLVRGFFWNKFQDKTLVEELSQETYVRMLKNFRHLRDPLKVRGFVTKVAYHVSQDHLRQKYRRREESLEPLLEKGARVEPVAPDGERTVQSLALENALSELPEKSRQILLLKVEGRKYEEIADSLGISVSGVKMQVKRSLERLRESVFL